MQRLLSDPESVLTQLQIVLTEDCLVILGDHAILPWFDGIQYIAPSQEAPELWLPTQFSPTLALPLIAQALIARHDASPLLLLREPAAVIALTSRQSLSMPLLHALLEQLS